MHPVGVIDGGRFSFPTAFAVEVDPEFPGNGEWDCPVFNYGRDGRIEPAIESRWGTPMVLRVSPDASLPWVGMFASGGLGGVRATIGCPSPSTICVLADGLAYVVNVEQPDAGADIASDQVMQVVPIPDPPLVLFVRSSDIVALGPAGVAWSSKRLCVDDLRVVAVSADHITCTCDNLGGSPTITVDPVTGEQAAGTTMRDLGWPDGSC
jgi:hypothetical protein